MKVRFSLITYFLSDFHEIMQPLLSSYLTTTLKIPVSILNVALFVTILICGKFRQPLLDPCKHKTFVQHLYNDGPTSSTLVQHCINVIQMSCFYWGTRWWATLPKEKRHRQKKHNVISLFEHYTCCAETLFSHCYITAVYALIVTTTAFCLGST